MSQKSASTPEARLAEALVTAVNEGADFSKAIEQIPEENRPKVEDLLSGLVQQEAEIPKIPQAPAMIFSQPKEIQEAIKSLNLEEDFEKAVETQSFFELLRFKQKIPDFNQILRVFTPEMLAIAQSFQAPTLILETEGQSFSDLVSAMDYHRTMPNQEETYVVDDDLNSLFWDSPSRQSSNRKPEEWEAHIIETPTEAGVHDFDDTGLTLEERLEEFTKYKAANGVNGMDCFKYIHFMMQKIKDGEPIDAELWRRTTILDDELVSSTHAPGPWLRTILDKESASGTRIPCARWSSNLHFGWAFSYNFSNSVRFRRSVGGEVPFA